MCSKSTKQLGLGIRGQELTAQFREHQSRSLAVGVSVLTPQSRALAVGVCQCSHISQDLPSGAVLLWGRGRTATPKPLCSSPAGRDSPRKASLLSVLHPSNLLQDMDFKACCAGLLPASNIASDMFKQIIDILFTKVFTTPHPSPVFSPAYFHQHNPVLGPCVGLPGSCARSEQAGVCT